MSIQIKTHIYPCKDRTVAHLKIKSPDSVVRLLCRFSKYVLLLFTPALLWNCGASTSVKNNPKSVSVTTPILTDTLYTKDYPAEVNAIQNIEIRSRIKGYLEKIHVDEGQSVKEGQLLFSISNQELKEEVTKSLASLKNAIANAKAAELDLENARLLAEKGIVSQTELAKARARLDALNAKTDEARSTEANSRLRQSYTEVRAPFAGVIDRLPNKTGSVINEGTLLTTLSDNSEVFAYFNVSENEYLSYMKSKTTSQRQTEVELILADNSIHAYKGKVETIEGEFNHGTGSIAFRARVPNPDKLLRHGASGKVRLKRHLRNILVIPQKSTFEIQDKIYVFTLDKNHNVRIKNIVPDIRMPHIYLLRSGLSTNDTIVYEGIQNIEEGTFVKPEFIPMKKILSGQSHNTYENF